MSTQILVVDDDSDILELLEYKLSKEGYEILGFLNTKHVMQALKEEDISLIIMDRNLHGIEGSLYIEMLRSKNINVPVIFLSAKNTLNDIKDGFIRGADDYITKPFDIGELTLRIKAVLNRYNSEVKDTLELISYKDMKLDLNLHTAIINSQEISLTKLETALINIMIKNRGKVLDRDFLIEHVWKDTKNIQYKTINVAIKRLKEKIDPDGNKEYIKTIRGVGYLLS